MLYLAAKPGPCRPRPPAISLNALSGVFRGWPLQFGHQLNSMLYGVTERSVKTKSLPHHTLMRRAILLQEAEKKTVQLALENFASGVSDY